jgi:hypothetical protein
MAEVPQTSWFRVLPGLAVTAGGVALAYRLMEAFRTHEEWTRNHTALGVAAALVAPMAIFIGFALFFRSIPRKGRSR